MNQLLIVFESVDGQSRKIAERADELARSRGMQTRTLHVSSVCKADVHEARGVLVIAPVRDRVLPASIADFVRSNHSLLDYRTTGLFTVSMGAAARQALVRRAIARVANDFLASLSWEPDVVAHLGGAIAYPTYSRAQRLTMQMASRVLGLPTDTSRVAELTKWRDVESKLDELITKIRKLAAFRHDRVVEIEPRLA